MSPGSKGPGLPSQKQEMVCGSPLHCFEITLQLVCGLDDNGFSSRKVLLLVVGRQTDSAKLLAPDPQEAPWILKTIKGLLPQ